MPAEHNDMDLFDLFNSSKELLYKVHRIRVMSQDIGSPWPFKINLLTNWVHNYILSILFMYFILLGIMENIQNMLKYAKI